MQFKSFTASLAFAAAAVNAAPAVVSQISDGQVQGPKTAGQAKSSPPPMPVVTQIGDGQVQAQTATPPMPVVTQIGDGQVQAPTSAPKPVVSQIGDGQVQNGAQGGASSGSGSSSPQSSSSGSGQKQFTFPLAVDGFPNPNATALKQIEKEAHGTLPNGPLPSKIADTSALVWSLIAFNEIFEVAYFSDLIHNITTNVTGYTESKYMEREVILEALYAIRAQEELHALGANGILKTAGRPTISPCKYTFPVNNLDDALSFAKTFTDLVVGTLQTALTSFGMDGDEGFLALVGSVIGQESQQVAAIRLYEGLIPSALPFLTIGGPAFAYSALNQLVVVPGSCPAGDSASIPIPVLSPLSVTTTKITNKTTTLDFAYTATNAPAGQGYSLVYINQQNVPIVEPMTNVKTSGNKVTFSAAFPYEENLLNSLTIASVVKGSGPFANSSAVAAAAVYGPGLIEFN